jgi:hypothetical protein
MTSVLARYAAEADGLVMRHESDAELNEESADDGEAFGLRPPWPADVTTVGVARARSVVR